MIKSQLESFSPVSSFAQGDWIPTNDGHGNLDAL